MSASLSLTETQVFTVLRTFLISVLPSGVEVIRAEINRVSEPVGSDFVVMTPVMRERIETNIDTYNDPYPLPGSVQNILQPTKLTVQLDVHGPASADNSQIVSTLFRDDYACQALAALNPNVQPLYAGEPRQTPFLNGEQQIEYRWVVDVVLQINPTVTVIQQFAGTLDVGLIDVDAVYPP